MKLKSRTSLVAIFSLVIIFSLFAGLLYHWNNVRTIDTPVKAIEDSLKKPKKVAKSNDYVGDVDFGPYMADLQRRIKRAWFPPKGNESKRIMVVFKVHKNGSMSNLRLVRESGVALADQAALKAVSKAAPFRPLPEGAPADVDIQFTFDYNVFKHGKDKGHYRRF